MERERLARGDREAGLLALLALCALLPVLAVVPYRFSIEPDVASAAAAVGYSNQAAYRGAVLVCLLTLAVAALLTRRRRLAGRSTSDAFMPDAVTNLELDTGSGVRYGELLLVVVAVVLLCAPPLLAGRGPFLEDQYFLSILHRMQGGQRPFVDFEFLFGPLMIYPARWWTEVFGFHLTSYYAYLALLEAAVFAALLFVVGRYVPKRSTRWAGFALLAVFFLNVLLGVNQNGVRRLLPLLALLVLASDPRPSRRIALGAGGIGLGLTYSPEYGVAALLAAAVMYAFLAIDGRDAGLVGRGAAIGGGSVLVWLAVSWALVGNGFGTYVRASLELMRHMSAGEAAFPFHWTLNALAAFGLLALSCVIVGRGLGGARGSDTSRGDFLLVAVLAYAIVTLKSGLSRCDMWHLDVPFVALGFAFVLPWRRERFRMSPAVRQIGLALLAVMAVTYLWGLAPPAGHVAAGWPSAVRDLVAPSGSDATLAVETEAPALELELSRPDRGTIELARYLADPARRDRAVLFYADTWSLDKMVGRYKRYYSNDDFLHSEERGRELARFLDDRPDALVLMTRPTYERLFDLADRNGIAEIERNYRQGPWKQLGSYLSTVHYEGMRLERSALEARWTRTVGQRVRDGYEPLAEFGDVLVLGRR